MYPKSCFIYYSLCSIQSYLFNRDFGIPRGHKLLQKKIQKHIIQMRLTWKCFEIYLTWIKINDSDCIHYEKKNNNQKTLIYKRTIEKVWCCSPAQVQSINRSFFHTFVLIGQICSYPSRFFYLNMTCHLPSKSYSSGLLNQNFFDSGMDTDQLKHHYHSKHLTISITKSGSKIIILFS